MTSIVGIRCTDGVVIGADSSTTFGDGTPHVRTIEQPTDHKIRIIGDHVIVAGTGAVGHSQRFANVVQRLWDSQAFANKSELEIAKTLSQQGLQEFGQTFVSYLQYAAFVAYPSDDGPSLCELPQGSMAPGQPTGFQPEMKRLKDLWFVSAGAGQFITDTLLALFREVFWKDGAPNVRGGIFTALWALRHACEVNTGGIKGPIRIAVLAKEKGQLRARMLDQEAMAEHENMVSDATDHMRKFLDVLEGKSETQDVPKPGAG